MRGSCAYAPLPVARCGRLPTWTRTRSERALLVIFSPDGEDDDAQLVTNGKRAVVTAVLMIAMRGEAQSPAATGITCSTTRSSGHCHACVRVCQTSGVTLDGGIDPSARNSRLALGACFVCETRFTGNTIVEHRRLSFAMEIPSAECTASRLYFMGVTRVGL
jgi:ferredoxin